jgi:hypothetical protein
MRSPKARRAFAASKLPLLLLACAMLAGCAGLGVAPWERDVLARRSMQLNSSALVLAADEHIYFAKEGSSGGRTFDGGGCGCNR